MLAMNRFRKIPIPAALLAFGLLGLAVQAALSTRGAALAAPFSRAWSWAGSAIYSLSYTHSGL
jgi:hypothetical protein